MTWQEYFDMMVACGSDPDLAMNAIGHMMDIYESYNWDAKVPFDVEE